MLIAIHRGGGVGPHQNKLEGIKEALVSGADIVEVDVNFSREGIPFMRHDRWINGKDIYDYSADELKQMGVDSLEDALSLFDTTFYIDLKGEPTKTFLDIIDGHDIIIGSFNGMILREMKELGFNTSLILSSVLPPEEIDYIANSVDADFVNLGWEHHLPSNYLSLLKRIKTPVISWTENSETVFRSLLCAVNVVMTDRIDFVKKYSRTKVSLNC